MKACAYCGRESANDATNCWECGTDFVAVQPETRPQADITQPLAAPTPELEELDMGFELVEGFSRPNWKRIHEFVKAQVPKQDWPAAWNYIAAKWLSELAGDLGGSAQLHPSDSFYCVSDLASEATRNLLKYAESVVATIREFLGPAAWTRFYGKHVLLLFSDPEDYYAYISYYHRDGTHIQSGGVFIRRGFAHVALPYLNPYSAHHVVVHELTHNLLCHLPLPLWLNEGLAMVIESRLAQRGPVLTRELAERHHQHWNEANLQSFWAGTSFDIPGDESELSYSLGEILVNLLSENGAAFCDFVRAADPRDGGQDAALRFLGHGLEETIGGFLGPGNWRPRRKAIKDKWDAIRKPIAPA